MNFVIAVEGVEISEMFQSEQEAAGYAVATLVNGLRAETKTDFMCREIAAEKAENTEHGLMHWTIKNPRSGTLMNEVLNIPGVFERIASITKIKTSLRN